MVSSTEQRKMIQRRQIQIATERKGAQDTDYFWSLVRQSSTGEIIPRSTRSTQAVGEDTNVFQEQPSRDSEPDEHSMDIYDTIPVERSGEGADEVHLTLTHFSPYTPDV
jgi:hypothetical protein